jgi:hypothetical protein
MQKTKKSHSPDSDLPINGALYGYIKSYIENKAMYLSSLVVLLSIHLGAMKQILSSSYHEVILDMDLQL